MACVVVLLALVAAVHTGAAQAQRTDGPVVSRAVTTGATLTLAYDEVLDASSVPATSAFTVTVNGETRQIRTPVQVWGPYVRLWLTDPVYIGDRVAVSYTPPATNPIQNSGGVKAAALNNRPVHNRSVVGPDPTPQPGEPASLSRAGQLVRNLNQNAHSLSVFHKDLAQAFTTGSNAQGYRLTSLELDFALAFGTDPAYSVSIHRDSHLPHSPPSPGTIVGTLTNPSAIGTGISTYTAPGDGIALDANTRYWVVVDIANYNTNASQTVLTPTEQDPEDCARPGWSIAHEHLSRGLSGTAWTKTDGLSLRLAVHGRLVGAAAPAVSNLCQRTVGSTANLASDVASSFTTGGERASYRLTQIDIDMSTVAGTPDYSVSIHSDSSGSPGSSLATLTNPSTLSVGTNSFTASGDGIKLHAYTTYWVVFDSQTNNAGSMLEVSESREDVGAAAGWSIGDTSRRRAFDSGAGFSTTSSEIMHFAVHARPEPGAGPVPSGVKLVGTTGQTSSGNITFNFDAAQAFTTGPNSQGYKLTRVELDFSALDADQSAYTVSIHSNSSSAPGSSLATLTKPSSLSVGRNAFHAPDGGVSLDANTTYWLVVDVDHTDNPTNDTTYRTTSSSAEDSGALAGWSIANALKHRNAALTAWQDSAGAMKLAIHGEVTGATAAPPARITADAQNVYIHLPKPIDTGTTGGDNIPAPHPMSGTRCPANAAFTLKVNGVEYGSWATRDGTAGPIDGNGLDGWRAKCNERMIHLELWNGPDFDLIPPGATLTLSYDPNWDATCPECRQVAYTDNTVMPAFTDMAVDNTTPYVWWTSVNGTDLLAYFFYSLAPWSAPAPDAFTVTVNGQRRNVAGVSFFGNYNGGVKLTLESPVERGDTVTLAYTQPTQNPLRGTRGNPTVPTFAEMGVRNDTPLPPGVVWEATLTVGGTTAGKGCHEFDTPRCSTALTDNNFEHRGNTYQVIGITSILGAANQSVATVTLDKAWPATLRNASIQVGEATWSLADAYTPGNARATWDPGFDYQVGAKVSFRMTVPASGGAGGAGGNSGPSPQSSSVSGNKLKMTFDEPLSQGLAPQGGSFKVTVGPGPQGGAGGNGGAVGNGGKGGVRGVGGAFGPGAQATSGVRATSGGGTVDIAGTGTVTVDGAVVTVTLARAVPPGSTVTVTYTPPDEDEDALRGLWGVKVQEFTDQPAAHGAPPANRAPVVDEESSNYAGFTAAGNAPRGVLVTKDFNGIFSDPDGDTLTYTVALSDPGQAALVELAHVLTPEELEQRARPDVVAHLVWFRADTDVDWGAMDPAPPDPVTIEVTVTATDPEGLSASVEGVFLTHWAPPRVESVAVVSDAGSDGIYALGDIIEVAVTFDEAVTVDTAGGVPQLAIDMDPAAWGTKWAAYTSGSGTRELVFAHTVVEPNHSTQGIAVLADTLTLNGGAIRLASPYQPTAAGTTDADLAHTGLGHDPNHKVDWQQAPAPAPAGTAPEVTAVTITSNAGSDRTYGLGDVIEITVTFSEAVEVTGSPQLTIDMDPAAWGAKQATYQSGSGTTTLTFTHTVVEPNYSTQGIAVLADTLTLNSVTIQSTAGAEADLSHSGLAHDTNHRVNWQQPSSSPGS